MCDLGPRAKLENLQNRGLFGFTVSRAQLTEIDNLTAEGFCDEAEFRATFQSDQFENLVTKRSYFAVTLQTPQLHHNCWPEGKNEKNSELFTGSRREGYLFFAMVSRQLLTKLSRADDQSLSIV